MKPRSVAAIGILGAWGAGLALFAQRELSRPETDRLAEVAMRVVPGVTWFAVERDGGHVGFASVTIDTVPRELQVTEYLVVEGPDRVRRLEQTTVRLSRGLALHAFETLRASGKDTARTAGEMTSDTLLGYAAEGGASGGAHGVRVSRPIFLMPLVPIVVALRERPRVGDESVLDVFMPEQRASRRLVVRVGAESLFVVADSAVAGGGRGRWLAVHRDTVRAWRLRSDDPGAALDVWVDELGQLVAATRSDGLTLRRTAFELAFENWRLLAADGNVAARAHGSVVASTLLASGVTASARPLDSLVVRLRVALPRQLTARLGWRFRSGHEWALGSVPAARLVPRYSLPTAERWQRAFARHLREEPRLEVADTGIMRLARRLTAGTSDPARAVDAILRWVSDSLARVATPSPVSAAGTLARGGGDAPEFARLFVALCRAAGVPAQTVGGLWYTGERFYYHAWAEVYLGGWVATDPMLRQFPADAAHLPLLHGGLDAQAELLRVLSRLELEVVNPMRSAGGVTYR
ncbi:MAG TPA: transglutaminase-like domain-containing protein [Gemmatimonadaceae bacterium]|nr:transglutaminase-like domain-containing protein [Gemmatimonadaceae bacterium]